MINDNKIRRDMMELWKETFHDSDHYINLVFDTYFISENAFTFYDGDRLVAALLGVEYEFKVPKELEEQGKIRGLYLCGLATRPEYRNKGIMSKLMKEAEKSALDRGFAITFLIPADDHLRDYYKNKGYYTTSYLISQPLEKVLYPSKSRMHIYTFKKLFELGKNKFVREVAQWCSDQEKKGIDQITILHSPTDMLTIIAENENSFFVTDSSFDLEYPILTKVTGVVFPKSSEEENSKEWSISAVYLKEDQISESEKTRKTIIPDSIRQSIQEKYQEIKFQLKIPFTGKKIKEETEEPYAMVKVVSNNEKYKEIENRIFKICLMLD